LREALCFVEGRPDKVMTLIDAISRRKSKILARWCDLVLGSYSADSAAFFKKEKDRFRNPVGYTITNDLARLFDMLLEGFDAEAVGAHLTFFIKMRSVQDFAPSQAVAFAMQLKLTIREELADELAEAENLRALMEFETRLDRLALVAFDLYMQCREKLHEIKTQHIKSGPFKQVDRACRSLDPDLQGEDHKDGET